MRAVSSLSHGIRWLGFVWDKMVIYCYCLVTKSCLSCSFATPWTVACQAPLSMGFPGKNTGVCCHFLLQGIFQGGGKIRDHVAGEAERNHCLCNVTFFPLPYPCVCVLSLLRRVQLFAALWTATWQAPLSMGFSRQEYWSGCHSLPVSI